MCAIDWVQSMSTNHIDWGIAETEKGKDKERGQVVMMWDFTKTVLGAHCWKWGQSGGYLWIAIGEQLFTIEKKMRKTEEGVVQGRKAAKNTSLQLTVRGPLTLQDEQQSAKDNFHQHIILPCPKLV
jgi:hypothetical protein